MDPLLLVAIGLLSVALITGAAYAAQQLGSTPERALRDRARRLALDVKRTTGSGESDAVVRRRLIQGKLKELEQQRRRSKQSPLRQQLLQAGGTMTMRTFLLICAGTGLVVGLGLLIAGMTPLIALVGAAGAAIGLPRFVLQQIINRRQAKFTDQFAEALDILVRGTRTGLPVGECLRIVGRELPDPVGFEFRMLVESQRLGMSIDQSLRRGLERMPTTEFQFFAVVLQIQQQTGGNLAATLENLSNVLRARKRLIDRIGALSSEAKASAAIIGSLPFFVCAMITLVNFDYIQPMFVTRLGHILLAMGLGWMLIGVLVMRGMIQFKF